MVKASVILENEEKNDFSKKDLINAIEYLFDTKNKVLYFKIERNRIYYDLLSGD
jgi:hypothetical protein